MPRKVQLKEGNFSLTEDDVEGFLERVVTPIGTSAKADIPKRYMGRRVYIVITKNKEIVSKE
jgi:putative transposon-encoded protein